MKVPTSNNAGGGAGGAETSLPHTNHSGTRLVASHCPGCMEELGGKVYMTAVYFSPTLTRRINYYLCKPCGQRVERMGRNKRKRFAETVERNLEALGVLVGLERQGGEA